MLHDFEKRYADARADFVADFALFLVGLDEEDAQRFLQILNAALERDIHMAPPQDKSMFIWKIIDDMMARVRAIAAVAPQQNNRSLH